MAVSADARGRCASFGVGGCQLSTVEIRYAHDMAEWIAAQPCCDGKVGMLGRSSLGIIQYFAATRAQSPLETPLPDMVTFDFNSHAYCSSVFHGSHRRQGVGTGHGLGLPGTHCASG